MSLKLRLASFWLPKSLVIQEIDKVAEVTIDCLDDTIRQHTPRRPPVLKVHDEKKIEMKGNLELRRRIMASAHNERVKILIQALGREEAMRIGRRAMFKAGYKLGRDAKKRLGVSNSLKDLILAAQVLYKVLGIEFKVIKEDGELSMKVQRCLLADYYTPETCRMLSAADEGVVYGLNENVNMKFKKRITEGFPECLATIKLEFK